MKYQTARSVTAKRFLEICLSHVKVVTEDDSQQTINASFLSFICKIVTFDNEGRLGIRIRNKSEQVLLDVILAGARSLCLGKL